MAERAPPAEGIQRHTARLRRLTDDEFLIHLRAVEPLPDADDDDSAWHDEATFDRAELLIAAANEIGQRRLEAGIAPLFERAALGDAWEMMQAIRHGPERAVAPEWSRLTAIMRPLVHHQRAGCRRWAVRELGILRDPDGLPELIVALSDTQDLVRSEACMSLAMLTRALEDNAQLMIQAELGAVAEADESEQVRTAASDALRRTG